MILFSRRCSSDAAAGVGITPLPEEEKPKFIKALIDDAVSKGARIVNGRGGQSDRTLVAPSVLFPVTPDMRVYAEEQFGPLVPVVEWTHEQELYCPTPCINAAFGRRLMTLLLQVRLPPRRNLRTASIHLHTEFQRRHRRTFDRRAVKPSVSHQHQLPVSERPRLVPVHWKEGQRVRLLAPACAASVHSLCIE